MGRRLVAACRPPLETTRTVSRMNTVTYSSLNDLCAVIVVNGICDVIVVNGICDVISASATKEGEPRCTLTIFLVLQLDNIVLGTCVVDVKDFADGPSCPKQSTQQSRYE